MSKKLKEAVRFLINVSDSDFALLATIYTAEAEKDYKRIIEALENVIDYAQDLKDHLVNEMFDPNAREL